ncbi:MAG: primosomal protein DnaI [Bacilli bacterium]|nr:primosomal protein DnaI [Bacilli bacterium]
MKKISDTLDVKKELDRNLKEEFHKSLKENEAFKNLVAKLKLKEEELMKYTSTLESSAIEYNNCMNCDGLNSCKNQITGYAYLPKVEHGKINFQYQACKYQQKYNKKFKYADNIYYFSLPNDLKNASMKNIYKEDKKRHNVIKWLSNFITEYKNGNKPNGLFLHGNFGCGKTYLVSAAFNELAKLDYKSAIIFWPEFLRELKSSFQTDFKEKYDYVKKVPLLLIDDIGAESNTPWSRDEILCPLIQYRMQEKLPTFFTSNFDLKSLEEHFSSTTSGMEIIKSRRIIERINQMTDSIEMISKNLRN